MMADTFVGGSETTAEALASGMMLLGTNRDVWRTLRENPEAHLRNFCEEVLRLESPVQGLFRRTTADVSLHGTVIPAGSTVNIRFGAANRDPRRFAHADQLDLERSAAGSHLAFGSGAHACVGAKLARRELYWGFKAFMERIDDFQLAPRQTNFSYKPSFILRGLRELEIGFTKK
jgi:cytochrome P450